MGYKTQILMSPSTAKRLSSKAFTVRPLDYVHLHQRPGARSELVHQVAPRSKKERTVIAKISTAYSVGLEQYRNKDFSNALLSFERANMKATELSGATDGASTLMMKRCKSYLECPPPAGWDGVWDANRTIN